jgi:hypothetical protein
MASKAANAHVALSMPSKGILSYKSSAARALIALAASVFNFCMAFEIVLVYEALAAFVALELSLAKMCLNMQTYVFPPAKDLAAILVQTRPLVRL